MYIAKGVLTNNSLAKEIESLRRFYKLLYTLSIVFAVIGSLNIYYNHDKMFSFILLIVVMLAAVVATVFKQICRVTKVSDENSFKVIFDYLKDSINIKLCAYLSTSWYTGKLNTTGQEYTYYRDTHEFKVKIDDISLISLLGDVHDYGLNLVIQDAEDIYKNFKNKGFKIMEV